MTVNECSNDAVNYSPAESEEENLYTSSDASAQPETPPSDTQPQRNDADIEIEPKPPTTELTDVFIAPQFITDSLVTVSRGWKTLTGEKPVSTEETSKTTVKAEPGPWTLDKVRNYLYPEGYIEKGKISFEACLSPFRILGADVKVIPGKECITGTASIDQDLTKLSANLGDNTFYKNDYYQFWNVLFHIGETSAGAQLYALTPSLMNNIDAVASIFTTTLPDFCEVSDQIVGCNLNPVLAPYLHEGKLDLRQLFFHLLKNSKNEKDKTAKLSDVLRHADGSYLSSALDTLSTGRIDLESIELAEMTFKRDGVQFTLEKGSRIDGSIALDDKDFLHADIRKLDLKLKNIRIGDINIPALHLTGDPKSSPIIAHFDSRGRRLELDLRLDLSAYLDADFKDSDPDLQNLHLTLKSFWDIEENGIFLIPGENSINLKLDGIESLEATNLELTFNKAGAGEKSNSSQSLDHPYGTHKIEAKGSLGLNSPALGAAFAATAELPLDLEEFETYGFRLPARPNKIDRHDDSERAQALREILLEGDGASSPPPIDEAKILAFSYYKRRYGQIDLPQLVQSLFLEWKIQSKDNKHQYQGDFTSPEFKQNSWGRDFKVNFTVDANKGEKTKSIVEGGSLTFQQRFDHYEINATADSLNLLGVSAPRPSLSFATQVDQTAYGMVVSNPRLRLRFPQTYGLISPDLNLNPLIRSVGVYLEMKGGVFVATAEGVQQFNTPRLTGFVDANLHEGEKIRLVDNIVGDIGREGFNVSGQVNLAFLGGYEVLENSNPDLPIPVGHDGRILEGGYLSLKTNVPFKPLFLNPRQTFEKFIRNKKITGGSAL